MRHLHAFKATVVGAMLVGGAVFAAAATRGDEEAPRKQLLITRVETDFALGRLRISGYGFCLEPKVTLAGERIAAASSGGAIVADLPPGIGCGDHLLTVQCGSATTGFDAWSLTTGAVGPRGPKGDRGARGARGRPGPAGLPGTPRLVGFYRRTASFRCRAEPGEVRCDMTEADRPIALCDEGDLATGGTAFEGNRVVADGISNDYPYPINTKDAPTGWTTPLREIGDGQLLNVIAICADMTP